MAKCDQGYLCDVCAEPVEDMADSDLYLRYIIGEVPYDQLMGQPERHIRCNPSQAQFIVHDDFEAVDVDGPFGKSQLDPQYVHERETLITRGWVRLQAVVGQEIHLVKYPLDEFQVE